MAPKRSAPKPSPGAERPRTRVRVTGPSQTGGGSSAGGASVVRRSGQNKSAVPGLANRTPSSANVPPEGLPRNVASRGSLGTAEQARRTSGQVTVSDGDVGASTSRSSAPEGPSPKADGPMKPESTDNASSTGERFVGGRTYAGASTTIADPSKVPQQSSGGSIDGVDDSSDSSDSDDEDGADWEDVDLSQQAYTNFLTTAPGEKPAPTPLSLSLGGGGEKSVRTVRKITAIERRIRLETHKMHILCLLHHVSTRNRWCNSREIQNNLGSLVPGKIRRLLIDDPRDQPFRRSQLFLEGLQILSNIWRRKFRVTRLGLRRTQWNGSDVFVHKGGDPPIGYREFVIISEMRKGSRDIGAQLFCAMLRAIGVTCRLVCSLQPLPFTFSRKDAPMPIPADSQAAIADKGLGYISKSWLRKGKEGDPGISLDESGHPVYWVEAWSVGRQKWIAVDPFCTCTVGKPSTIEPSTTDAGNLMSYAVAFEDDGDCTDVTRRYAKAFIGKTRRSRVSDTKDGDAWWGRVLDVFATGAHPIREQIEQAELANKQLHEPLPKSVKDLKGHPLYVLERHLKRDEVLKQLKKVGSLTTGMGKNKKTEIVYRRQDVIKLRSLDNWARLGRPVKLDQELKPQKWIRAVRLPSSRLRNARYGDGSYGGENDMKGLYAEYQTELYIPKPLVNGRLVKNMFGNIELFVSSMLPEGAAHLPQKNMEKAARLLGVDYAPAITDFEYRHGQAHAVTTGIVVAVENKEAIEAVHERLTESQDEKATRKRDAKALGMWRRFITKMRILEHVGRIPEESESASHPMTMMATEKGKGKAVEKGVVEVVDEEEGRGGGFFAEAEEAGAEEDSATTKNIRNPQSLKSRINLLKSSTKPTKPHTPKTTGGARKAQTRKSRYTVASDSDSDESESGGFFQEHEAPVTTPRRSTRITRSTRSTTKPKYTVDSDPDSNVEENKGEEEGEEEEGDEEGEPGDFLKEDSGSSELSDAPSGLLSEDEELVRLPESRNKGKGRAVESSPELDDDGDDGAGGFFVEEGLDLDAGAGGFLLDEDNFAGGFLLEEESEAPIGVSGGGAEVTDRQVSMDGGGDKPVETGIGPEDNNTSAGGFLVEDAHVVAVNDTEAPVSKPQDRGGGQDEDSMSSASGSMLSEDPEDKDNSDLDWCN